MIQFMSVWKRRIAKKEILLAMMIALVLMFISYGVRASPEIATYFEIKNGTHFSVQQLPGVLSEEAAARTREDYLTVAASQAFSFYIFMSNGFALFHLGANILIVFPVLSFFDERKNGHLQLAMLRYHSWNYIAQEAVATALTSMLVVLLPSVVYWLLAAVIAPANFPLSQNFGPFSDDFFQVLGQPQNAKLLFGLLILLNSILYLSKAFLAFSAALFVERKAVLLFVPLAFSYAAYILFSALGIPAYGLLSHFDEHMKTLMPLFTSALIPLMVASALLLIVCKKERILHA